MTLSLPVSGYVPGQDIPITVDVENNSDVPIREVKCTLRKVWETVYFVFQKFLSIQEYEFLYIYLGWRKRLTASKSVQVCMAD